MTERVPAVRFHEFTGEWEETRLGDHLALSRGLTYSPRSVRPHGVRVLRSSNIAEDRLVLREDDVFVAPEIVNVGLASDSDILITAANGSTRLVGKHCVVSGVKNSPSVPGGFMLLGKTATPHFTQALLGAQWYEGFINRNVAGGNGAIGNLRPNDLSSEVIPFPTLSEQQKIGELFEHLDSLIVLGRTELRKLRQMKTAMLGKMFPKPGATVPEVRFPGFDGEWEERELGEVAIFSKGSGYSKSDLTDHGVPIILYGRLYTKYESAISEVDTYAELRPGSKLSTGNEVIVPASGETSEDIARASAVLQSGVVIAGDLNIIYPARSLHPHFLALRLSNGEPHTKLAERAQGKSVVHLHSNDFADVSIQFPSLSEQQKIGEFFETLDSLIDLQVKKGEKLSQIKRSLLSKMFV